MSMVIGTVSSRLFRFSTATSSVIIFVMEAGLMTASESFSARMLPLERSMTTA